MIYTCYEMVADCRADKPEGWLHFVSSYVPVIRKLLAHYATGSELERVLTGLRNPQLAMFHPGEPAQERWFVAELRQKVVSDLEFPAAEIEIDLETVAAALEPLTLVERQAAWTQTMRYDAAASGSMMRISPQTVEKVRARADELLRGKVDAWRPHLLAENGPALGRAAAASTGKDCLGVKVFLDLLDGRTTWRGRETMEQHARSCWRCIDHFCRMMEVVELLRGVQPLTDAESEPFRKLLGLHVAKPPLWKRIAGR
jgi:hypothetical protein